MKKFSSSFTARAALILLGVGVTPLANAGFITTFNDSNLFNAAIGTTPITVETFSTHVVGTITSGILNSGSNIPSMGIIPGSIQPGVTYSTPIGTGYFFNIDCCFSWLGIGIGSGTFLDTVSANGPLTVTFDNDTLAFGFRAGLFINALNVAINFVSDPSVVFDYQGLSGNGAPFYGFVSSATDIKSVVIGGSTNNVTFAVDDFRFTTSPVPEPATYTMLLAGLGLMGFVRRPRKDLAA